MSIDTKKAFELMHGRNLTTTETAKEMGIPEHELVNAMNGSPSVRQVVLKSLRRAENERRAG